MAKPWQTTELTNEAGDKMEVTENGSNVTTRVNGKVIATNPVGDGHGKPEEVHRQQAAGWNRTSWEG